MYETALDRREADALMASLQQLQTGPNVTIETQAAAVAWVQNIEMGGKAWVVLREPTPPAGPYNEMLYRVARIVVDHVGTAAVARVRANRVATAVRIESGRRAQATRRAAKLESQRHTRMCDLRDKRSRREVARRHNEPIQSCDEDIITDRYDDLCSARRRRQDARKEGRPVDVADENDADDRHEKRVYARARGQPVVCTEADMAYDKSIRRTQAHMFGEVVCACGSSECDWADSDDDISDDDGVICPANSDVDGDICGNGCPIDIDEKKVM
jgi:hypothetical protein